mmetsp:Transcript_50016/g.161799  ORF Transcript_50016/g.161799 Transcript_50016/m.161799 type:complete len:1166 (-) Transcript_50016:142-3639(-)
MEVVQESWLAAQVPESWPQVPMFGGFGEVPALGPLHHPQMLQQRLQLPQQQHQQQLYRQHMLQFQLHQQQLWTQHAYQHQQLVRVPVANGANPRFRGWGPSPPLPAAAAAATAAMPVLPAWGIPGVSPHVEGAPITPRPVIVRRVSAAVPAAVVDAAVAPRSAAPLSAVQVLSVISPPASQDQANTGAGAGRRLLQNGADAATGVASFGVTVSASTIASAAGGVSLGTPNADGARALWFAEGSSAALVAALPMHMTPLQAPFPRPLVLGARPADATAAARGLLPVAFLQRPGRPGEWIQLMPGQLHPALGSSWAANFVGTPPVVAPASAAAAAGTATASAGPLQEEASPEVAELEELSARFREALALAPRLADKLPARAASAGILEASSSSSGRLQRIRGSLSRRLCRAKTWLAGAVATQIKVRVVDADLRPLAKLFPQNGLLDGHLFCSLRAGTPKEIRNKATRQIITSTAPSSGGLRPSWEGQASAELTFMTSGDEGLQIRVKIMRVGSKGKQVLAVAEMEVPPGRHSHQVPLLCALAQAEGLSGLLSLTLETEVEVVHTRVTCEACGSGPIRGTRYCCMQCHGYSLCSECYGRRDDLRDGHEGHDFVKLGGRSQGRFGSSSLLLSDDDSEDLSGDFVSPVDSGSTPWSLGNTFRGMPLASLRGSTSLWQSPLEFGSAGAAAAPFGSSVSAAASRATYAELRSEDLVVHLDLFDGSAEDVVVEHPGLLYVSDPENRDALVIQEILPGLPAARWNQTQVDRGHFEEQIVPGDTILEVNGLTGCGEQMADAMCDLAPVLRLRIMRPTRHAKAVLQVSGGDLHAARDILLGDAAAVMPLHTNRSEEMCQICASSAARGEALRIRPCGHGWFCKDCVRQWAASQVVDGRCCVACPNPECKRPIGHRQLRSVLPNTHFERLVRRSVELLCAADDAVVACPTPDCPYRAWLGEGQEPRLVCECCCVESCVSCAATPYHHGLTCEDEARRSELSQGMVERVSRRIEDVLREALVQKCPGCHAPIERMDACVHLTCPGCRYEFSWVCGQDWAVCREHHGCTRRGVYLPEILRPLAQQRMSTDGLDFDFGGTAMLEEDQASDLFLELRCIYLLSKLKHEVPPSAWAATRSDRPDLLRCIIRGRSVQWSTVGDDRLLQRLQRVLPDAFPAFDR